MKWPSKALHGSRTMPMPRAEGSRSGLPGHLVRKNIENWRQLAPNRLADCWKDWNLEAGLDTREQRRIQGLATLSMVQSGLMLRPGLCYSFTFIIVPEILQNQGNKLPPVWVSLILSSRSGPRPGGQAATGRCGGELFQELCNLTHWLAAGRWLPAGLAWLTGWHWDLSGPRRARRQQTAHSASAASCSKVCLWLCLPAAARRGAAPRPVQACSMRKRLPSSGSILMQEALLRSAVLARHCGPWLATSTADPCEGCAKAALTTKEQKTGRPGLADCRLLEIRKDWNLEVLEGWTPGNNDGSRDWRHWAWCNQDSCYDLVFGTPSPLLLSPKFCRIRGTNSRPVWVSLILSSRSGPRPGGEAVRQAACTNVFPVRGAY